jgi:hypothetical protein
LPAAEDHGHDDILCMFAATGGGGMDGFWLPHLPPLRVSFGAGGRVRRWWAGARLGFLEQGRGTDWTIAAHQSNPVVLNRDAQL